MGILGGVAVAVSLYGFAFYQNNIFSITKLKIKAGVKKRIRILQLSDLHGKSFGKDNKRLLESILNQRPNLIVVTGDLIDSNLKNMEGVIEFLGTINKEIPVVYIAGNNENRSGELEEIIAKLKKKQVTVLVNEIVTLNIRGNKVNILGFLENLDLDNKSLVKKAADRYYYSGANDLLMKLEKKEGLKVVLSHYPENFEAIEGRRYSDYNFDIMFAGHAHGGQWILPFVGGVFAPGQGLFPKYYAGMYGNTNKLIVSRGLGNSGFPLRLFNKPDIVVVDID